MLPNDSQLFSLIQSLNTTDPVLKDLLRSFVVRIQTLNAEVFPPSTATVTDTTVEEVVTVIPDITSFTYELISQGIRFTWNRPDPSVVLFEIRLGATWETGSVKLTTSTLSAVLDGLAVGTYKYWIKGLALDGTYSTNALSLSVVIPPIGAISVGGSVIDNFVLLSWAAPTSAFRIDYYVITKGGVEIGKQTGTFTPIFENTGGTYTYGVKAVDIFGNQSSVYTKDFIIAQPPDYVLGGLETSDLTGTRTNLLRESSTPSIFANVDTTETWADVIANGYTSLQDEINAGYPYFLQPTELTGEYEEVFDFGSIIDGAIVNIDWNINEIVPSMQIDVYTSTSLDNVTYTSETSGVSVYAPMLRYVKLRIEFTALT